MADPKFAVKRRYSRRESPPVGDVEIIDLTAKLSTASIKEPKQPEDPEQREKCLTLPPSTDSTFLAGQKFETKIYLTIPVFTDKSLPLVERLKNHRQCQDFLLSTAYYQKFDVPKWFPDNLIRGKKNVLVKNPEEPNVYLMLSVYYDENGIRMKSITKDFLLSNFCYQYDDEDDVRGELMKMALDLFIVKFLKHKNILSTIFVNSEPSLGSYQIVFPVHTTLNGVLVQLRKKNPTKDRLLDGTRIPRYIMREVAEGMKFLHDSLISVEQINVDQVFISRSGNVRLGSFERSCTVQRRKNNPEPVKNQCRALAALYMEMIMAKFCNAEFYKKGTFPTTRDMHIQALTINEYWKKMLKASADDAIVLTEDEIKHVMKFFDENTTLEDALKEKRFFGKHDAAEDIVKLLKEVKIVLAKQVLTGKQQPLPLTPPLNSVTFVADLPIVEFQLDFKETTSFRTFDTNTFHRVKYPHRLLQYLFNLAETAQCESGLYYLQPGDIVALSTVMFELILEIEEMCREKEYREQMPWDHFVCRKKIRLGPTGSRKWEIGARLHSCKSIDIEKAPDFAKF